MTNDSGRAQRRKGPAIARDLPRDEEILKIAAQVLWREGLRATVQEIGDAAGIHKASLYHYFATKREILERIAFWAAERMDPPLHDIRSAGLTPAGQLAAALRHYAGFLLENPAEMGLIIFEVKRFDEELAATIAPYRDTYEAWFFEVIRHGMKQGEFRPGDPRVDAYLIFGLANGLLYWYNPAGRVGPAEVTEQVVAAALRLLGAGEELIGRHTGPLPTAREH